jgi:hypothetical protein
MKLRTAVCIAFLGLATLACGGGASSGTDLSSLSTPLTEPWTTMSLPTDGGTVIYSDSMSTTITWSNGSKLNEIGDKLDSAVKGAGWSEKAGMKMTDMGIYSNTYEKDGKTVSLAGSEAAGMVSFTLSTY